MTFTLSDIQSAGHPPVTAVVVTNADDFAGVELLADGGQKKQAKVKTHKKYKKAKPPGKQTIFSGVFARVRVLRVTK